MLTHIIYTLTVKFCATTMRMRSKETSCSSTNSTTLSFIKSAATWALVQ